MPRKKGPNTLRAVSLKNICENFELICYGMTWSHREWREVLKTGRYLTVTSPLKALPVHVLSELAEVVLDDLGSAPHILHAVIQPQLTRIRLPPTLRTVPLAVKLIVERTHKLTSFELTSCRSVNPLGNQNNHGGYNDIIGVFYSIESGGGSCSLSQQPHSPQCGGDTV